MTTEPLTTVPHATPQEPGAPIPLASLPNLRDLGGWAADGGPVRHGLVYRSTALSHLTDADLARLSGLGVRAVVDLRTAGERDQAPDRLPTGAREIVADVLAGASGAAPAQLDEVLASPAEATAAFGDGRATALFTTGYREIVDLPSARAAYRTFFTTLAEVASRPTLFHCTTGKDRTGWAAASLLLLLGVAEDDVMRDYLLTNEQLRPALQPTFDAFAAAGGDPALLEPVLGVREEYLATSLERMHAQFGDVESYVVDGLGVEPAVVAVLRSALVERPSR